MVSRSATPCSRPGSSAGTSTTSASIARAAVADDGVRTPTATHQAARAVVERHRRAVRHCQRAAISALRLPAVPPLTNTPPASAGSPARSAIYRSASFSANTAPPPSSHEPP